MRKGVSGIQNGVVRDGQTEFKKLQGEVQMLVLTRTENESVIIGDDIEIVVTEVRGKKVRLGINAPRDITVHRKEIYEAIQAQNQK